MKASYIAEAIIRSMSSRPWNRVCNYFGFFRVLDSLLGPNVCRSNSTASRSGCRRHDLFVVHSVGTFAWEAPACVSLFPEVASLCHIHLEGFGGNSVAALGPTIM